MEGGDHREGWRAARGSRQAECERCEGDGLLVVEGSVGLSPRVQLPEGCEGDGRAVPSGICAAARVGAAKALWHRLLGGGRTAREQGRAARQRDEGSGRRYFSEKCADGGPGAEGLLRGRDGGARLPLLRDAGGPARDGAGGEHGRGRRHQSRCDAEGADRIARPAACACARNLEVGLRGVQQDDHGLQPRGEAEQEEGDQHRGHADD